MVYPHHQRPLNKYVNWGGGGGGGGGCPQQAHPLRKEGAIALNKYIHWGGRVTCTTPLVNCILAISNILILCGVPDID